jgi:tetratricopeptide (TPR) repeat protein
VSVPPHPIFLSYARDDATAARRIAEALRSAGLEVWFDENELRGGDAWDAKIRRQINDCALFVPLISQHTQARHKGYFRLEWKLAVDQTHLLAEGVPFVAPVVIDDTRESGAVVPPEFLRVQWMRLPGALPTPEFVGQVKRLLEGPGVTGVANPGRAAEIVRPVEPAPARPAPSRRRIALTIGAVAVVVIGIVGTWMAMRKPDSAARRSAPTTTDKTTPASEARQLVAKARQLYEPWDFATADDFALAEKLLKRAIELDPTDAETWAASAILSCGRLIFIWEDSSGTRRSTLRTQAENAIKLDPESNQARFARAFSLRFNPQTRDESIRLLREEAGRQPANRFVLRILGATLRVSGQHEQALVYLDKAAALPGSDPITHYLRGDTLARLKRFAEAEAAYDEALAIAPNYVAAHAGKLHLVLRVGGDIARAQALLAKLPPAFFLDPYGADEAFYLALYLRDSGKCLEWVRNVAEFSAYSGPKALLTARAHHLAGNEEAARTDLRAALRVVDDRLVAEPNNSRLLFFRADILAKLDDRPAAQPLVRELAQRVASGDRDLDESLVAQLQVQLNQRAEALASLENYFRDVKSADDSRVWLRFDPIWDPLRGDPRFEAMLKAPELKR